MSFEIWELGPNRSPRPLRLRPAYGTGETFSPGSLSGGANPDIASQIDSASRLRNQIAVALGLLVADTCPRLKA